MYYLVNFICAQMMSRSSCLVHFDYLCTVAPRYYAPRYYADSDIRWSVVDPDFLPPGEMPNGPA